MKSVGVIREDNSMADEYVDFFRHNARLRGIAIATDQLIATFVKDPKTAALDGTQEIALSVLATTLTIVAVFLPVDSYGP